MAKIRVINGERYVPVKRKTAKILAKSDKIIFYRIGNLKTLFIKVNVNN